MKDINRQVKAAKPRKRHDADWDNSNYSCTAANQQKSSIVVPVWQKAALTVEEAAAYSNIGICKLNELAKKPNCPFVLYIGKKKLVKRKKFEEYLSDAIEI